MPTIHDFGDVTATRTEWGVQRTYLDRDPPWIQEQSSEEEARTAVAEIRNWLATLDEFEDRTTDHPSSADVVSRTVTSFTDGSTLLGPWRVTE